MKDELKDLAWSVLPKEAREEIRNIVKTSGMGIHGMFDLVFGGNVTSDEEPKEMLSVRREDVIQAYSDAEAYYNANHECADGNEILENLFGKVKCLPDHFAIGDKVKVVDYDKSISSLSFYKGKICVIVGISEENGYRLELVNDADKSSYVNGFDRAEDFLKTIQWAEHFIKSYKDETIKKPTPMYSVGSTVKVNLSGNEYIVDIIEYDDSDNTYQISRKDHGTMLFVWVKEHQLAPYTGTKFKVGDKVRIIGCSTEATRARIGEIGEVLDIDTSRNAYFVLYRKGQDWMRSCDLEIYTEHKDENKDDIMKENKLGKEDNFTTNELNLAELLVYSVGDKIYMPDEGDVIIERVDVSLPSIIVTNNGKELELVEETIEIKPTGFAYAYPSKEAFLAYPLDARTAWLKWKANREPKIQLRLDDDYIAVGIQGIKNFPDDACKRLLVYIDQAVKRFFKENPNLKCYG